MPAPQASAMQQFARLKFSGNALQVPDQYKPPANQEHYGKAFKDSEKTSTPATTAPPLFTPATLNKYHTDTQKKLTDDIGGFMDKACSAICNAWSQWQSTAVLTGVVIAGPVATGGVVSPIPLGPLMMPGFAGCTPAQMKYAKTIMSVLGTTWATYTATITSPGLPLWPTFAMFPSPAIVMIPNVVPMPVVSFAPGGAAMMQAQSLSTQMFGQHGDPKAAYAREIFDAIASAFSQCFMIWQTSTMLNNIMANGTVPTMMTPIPVPGPAVAVGAMMPGGFT